MSVSASRACNAGPGEAQEIIDSGPLPLTTDVPSAVRHSGGTSAMNPPPTYRGLSDPEYPYGPVAWLACAKLSGPTHAPFDCEQLPSYATDSVPISFPPYS